MRKYKIKILGNGEIKERESRAINLDGHLSKYTEINEIRPREGVGIIISEEINFKANGCSK